MDGYFDLGTYSRTVSTRSPDAQDWFDRGLIWSYAFNHEEAAACFTRALEADSNCAMAYWGLAYALGPNYNKPWEFFDDVDLRTSVARAHAAMAGAEAHVAGSTDAERALIEATRSRYPSGTAIGDCSVWNVHYADQMRRVRNNFPDDLDMCALFADALMNLTPWALWDLSTGQPAIGAFTVEARGVLEHALSLDAGASHPGILHMYIHLMEMSPWPEQALVVGDKLRGLVPDAGHLHHMPTHLDVLCGDYRSVMASNTAAVEADQRFLNREGPMNFYTLYRCHDLHFLIYGAMFAGHMETAMAGVFALEATIPEDLLRVEVPPMADWLEGFLSVRAHVLIRFGQWEEILRWDCPADTELYCMTTAMLHYAKGVAFSATGRVAEAEHERGQFREAAALVPDSRTLFNNTCPDILGVASAMLDGELEYRRGNFGEAFRALEESIALDDCLPYDEPWGWMQPTRHAYGALLLEQGRVEEAEAVYRADLGLDESLPRSSQHPGNVWSLAGYLECLERLGKEEPASIIRQQLRIAAAHADVPVESSCFCRVGNGGSSCCSSPTHSC